jgi:hypothetical protein
MPGGPAGQNQVLSMLLHVESRAGRTRRAHPTRGASRALRWAVLLPALALAAGCGGRTPLGGPPSDGGVVSPFDQVTFPPDGTVTPDVPFPDLPPPPPPDFFTTDGPLPDLPRPDLPPPPDGGPANCTPDSPVTVVTGNPQESLSYPALAVGAAGQLLLTYNRMQRQRPSELRAVPIDENGNPLGGPQRVGDGQGGTLVEAGAIGATFAVAFMQGQQLQIGFLNADGTSPVAVNATGIASATLRPGFVVGTDLLAIAWDDLNQGTATVAIIDTATSNASMLAVRGNMPWLALAPGGTTEQVWVLGETMDTVGIDRYDINGMTTGMRDISSMLTTVSPTVARVVDNLEGGAAVLGTGVGTGQASVYLDLGGRGLTADLGNQKAIDLGAAYDPQSGWLLAAASGAFLDSTSAQISVHGLSPSGLVSAPVATVPGLDVLPRPAVVATGRPGVFLVVWESRDVNSGSVLQAARVTCSP